MSIRDFPGRFVITLGLHGPPEWSNDLSRGPTASRRAQYNCHHSCSPPRSRHLNSTRSSAATHVGVICGPSTGSSSNCCKPRGYRTPPEPPRSGRAALSCWSSPLEGVRRPRSMSLRKGTLSPERLASSFRVNPLTRRRSRTLVARARWEHIRIRYNTTFLGRFMTTVLLPVALSHRPCHPARLR